MIDGLSEYNGGTSTGVSPFLTYLLPEGVYMQYSHNKQRILDAMKRNLPVIHDGEQYDQIVEYGIQHDTGYAFLILRKEQKLIFTGAGDVTFREIRKRP